MTPTKIANYCATRIAKHLYPVFPPNVNASGTAIIVRDGPIPNGIITGTDREYQAETWQEVLRAVARGEKIDPARMERLIKKTEDATVKEVDVVFDADD